MSAMDACAQSWRVGISGAAIALALFPLVALAQVADHSTMPQPPPSQGCECEW